MQNRYGKMLVICITVIFLAGLSLTVQAEKENVEKILETAPSASDYPDQDAVMIRDRGVMRQEEERTIFKNEVRIKTFNRQGRNDYGEIRIPFSSELEEVEIDYIRTINPDGEVVEPDEDSIRIMTHPVTEDAPMYSDIKLKVISMPALENGSIIDYAYTKTSTPMMEGELGGHWLFQTEIPVISSYYEVIIPEEKTLNWKFVNGEEEPEVKTTGGETSYIWQLENLEEIEQEPGQPPLVVLSSGIIVSTVEDWEEIAGWYQELLADRVEPDQAIKDKVEELIEPGMSREEKITAIYDYVATEIRYVAIEFGMGKVQPYAVEETFANKYGDCKDQSSLLVSMLRTAGIDSYLTLINAGKMMKTYFSGPATVGGFNHAIAAVKKADGEGYHFLDPTCDICSWDYLPHGDRDKKVLVVKGSTGEIISTDPIDYTLSGVDSQVEAVLSEKGNLKTEVEINPTGHWSYLYRSVFQSYSANEKKQLFQQVLSNYISGASLTEIEHSDADDNYIPVKMELKYSKKNYAGEAAGMLLVKPPATLRLPFSMTFGSNTSESVEDREYPLLITAAVYRDLINIEVPEDRDWKLPKDKEIDSDIAAYTSTYSADAGVIQIERILTIKKPVINPGAEYAQLKEVVELMRSDEEEQIVLE